MSDHQNNQQNIFLFFIGLCIVAAFLIGNLWGKVQSLKEGSVKSAVADKKITPTAPAAAGPTQTPFDAPDKDKANIKFFVMSFCPFGNQAEDGLKPVYELLKDKAEWEPHYVIYAKGYCEMLAQRGSYKDAEECSQKNCLKKDGSAWFCSMHGRGELNQDIREVCAWNLTKDKSQWWNFVDLINKNCNSENVDECWEKYAKEAKLAADKIKSCFSKEAISLLDKEVEIGKKFEAEGSPMVFINDQIFNGGRTPEAYKTAICSGFKNPPKECQTKLSDQGAAAAGGCE